MNRRQSKTKVTSSETIIHEAFERFIRKRAMHINKKIGVNLVI
jgi:hypothetical protein